MQKETFIIRTEWYDAISELEPTDQATIFRNLFAYHADGEIVLDTFPVRIVWKLIVTTLERNIESYDKRRETSAENGKKGGRGNKVTDFTDIILNKPNLNLNKPNLNLNNQQVYLDEPNYPNETLSDSVYVSVSDSVSVRESDDVLKKSLSSEKIKNYPEEVLKAPTPDNAADAIFYEVEICKNLRISFDELPLIWNKWMNSRSDKLLTKREARNDFRSYASSWKLGDKHRSPNQRPTPQAAAPIYEPSG